MAGSRQKAPMTSSTVRFVLDPNDKANEQIVDLKLAPRNAAGKVEFSADFRMLLPADRFQVDGIGIKGRVPGDLLARPGLDRDERPRLDALGLFLSHQVHRADVDARLGRPRLPRRPH